MEFTYPASDFDKPRVLLATLGSFWAEVYNDRLQLDATMRAGGSIGNQTVQDLLEAADSLARGSVPVYHTDNWYLLRLRRSELNTSRTSLATYDGNRTYGDGLLYDVPPDTDTFTFPAPADLVAAPIVMNRFAEPSLTWYAGQEFTLEPGKITFLENPFDDLRVARRHIYEDGAVVDEEVSLWVFKGEFDWDAIYQQYGYVIGLRMQSSKGYREVVDAFLTAVVGGTVRRNVERAFSAMTGIPLVIESNETVETVAIDNNHRLVVTDQHVYKFNPAVTVTVEEGDELVAGDSLVDALEFIELNRGEVPEDLRSLAMGKGFLATCYFGDLVFENKDVPLEVTEADDHPTGFTFVKFGLGGFPADVEKFFDDIHDAGIAESQLPVDECSDDEVITIPGDECEDIPEQQIRRGTLAHLLDTRPNRQGEPTAAALPSTINPLQFLVSNVLRNNASIVRVKVGQLGDKAVGLHALSLSRKIIPPHTAMLILYETTPVAETVTSNQVTENLSSFTAMEPLSDSIAAGAVSESQPGIRIVSGTCQ